MVVERFFVNGWNILARYTHLSRPFYHFPVAANFMGLNEGVAQKINS